MNEPITVNDIFDVSLDTEEIRLIDHVPEPFKRAKEMKMKYPLWK